MKADIAKYFWDLNEIALAQTKGILKNPNHPKFTARFITFLSRCDKPRELFSLISKEEFIEFWPKVRSCWRKISGDSSFVDWWETVYEQLAQDLQGKKITPKGKSAKTFLRIGRMIKEARVEKGLSQNGLALRAGMKQPDISRIEEGRKNITLGTLSRLCKILGIERLELK